MGRRDQEKSNMYNMCNMYTWVHVQLVHKYVHVHGRGFKVSTYMYMCNVHVHFSTCTYVKLKDGWEKGEKAEEGGKRIK